MYRVHKSINQSHSSRSKLQCLEDENSESQERPRVKSSISKKYHISPDNTYLSLSGFCHALFLDFFLIRMQALAIIELLFQPFSETDIAFLVVNIAIYGDIAMEREHILYLLRQEGLLEEYEILLESPDRFHVGFSEKSRRLDARSSIERALKIAYLDKNSSSHRTFSDTDSSGFLVSHKSVQAFGYDRLYEHHIAVYEADVFSMGFQYGIVLLLGPFRSFFEDLIRISMGDFLSRIGREIIHHDYLDILVGLALYREQAILKRFRRVFGRDDNRDKWLHEIRKN